MDYRMDESNPNYIERKRMEEEGELEELSGKSIALVDGEFAGVGNTQGELLATLGKQIRKKKEVTLFDIPKKEESE